MFERLLDLSKHVKIWLSFAEFETAASVEQGRAIYERAAEWFASADTSPEERALLLKTWLEFEQRQPVNPE